MKSACWRCDAGLGGIVALVTALAGLSSAIMVDASAPGPQGALRGTTIQFGDFDECLALSDRGPVEPQFCVVMLTAEAEGHGAPLPLSSGLPWTNIDDLPPHVDVLQVFQGVGQHYTAPALNALGSGLCVPAACSPAQLARAAALLLERRPTPLRWRASVPRQLCTSRQDWEAGARARVPLLWGCTLLGILVLVGTVVDSGDASDSRRGVRRVLSAWSLRRSLALLSLPPRPFHGWDLRPLAGIRVLMAVCVIIVHHHHGREVLPSSATKYTSTGSSAVIRPFTDVAFASMDSFFFVSGFFFLPTLKETLVKSVIHRILRLLSIMIIVVFFSSFFLPYLGTGPFWKAHSEGLVENCSRTWWMDFFFISTHSEKCSVPLWSVGVDMQLYLVVVAAVALWRWALPPRLSCTGLGVGGCLLAVAASALLRVVVALRERWPSSLCVTSRVITASAAEERFWNVYGSVARYIVPYVSGIILWSVMTKLIKRRFTLTKLQTRVCSLAVLALFVLLAARRCRECRPAAGQPPSPSPSSSPLRSALQDAAWQALWSLLWVLIGVVLSPVAQPNVMKDVLSAPVLLNLAHLAVPTYEFHYFPILVKAFSSRAPSDPSALSDVLEGLGTVALCFIGGLALYLTVEAPLLTLKCDWSSRTQHEKSHGKRSVRLAATIKPRAD